MKKLVLLVTLLFTCNSFAAAISIVNQTDQTIYVRDSKNHHYWIGAKKTLKGASIIGKIGVCWVNNSRHIKNSTCVPLTEIGWPVNESTCKRVFKELVVTGTCNYRLDPNDATEFCRDRLPPTIECR